MDKRSAIFIALSFIILVLMFYFVGIDKIIDALRNADLALIAVAILVQLVTFILYTIRWKLINSSAGINVSFKSLLPITMVGLAVSNITPQAVVVESL